LHEFITTPQHRRQLLLGQQQPQCNTTRQLSKAYNNYYDDILLRIKQANDYFLLVGPPGTGKTSMALRFMVEEELYGVSGNEASPQILITSYTNRAVDEICSMLENAGIDFLRLGNENSCDPRFRKNLLETALDDKPKLNAIKQRIEQCRVIVGTTSTLQARPFIFQLKHFSLAIIDEASQILEPNIIGLLAAHDRKGHCCIDRFVLIGDYKQLPAVVQQDEKSARVNNSQLRDICLTDCRLSLFERLIRWEKKNKRTQFIGILRHQGRMHPEIAEFPNEMFYREEQLEPVPCPHQLDTSLNYTATAIDWTDHLMKQRRMIFIPAKPDDNNDTSEKANAKEAAIVADILRRVVRFYGDKFNPNNTVGVIVPYRNQIAMIRREIEKLNMPQLRDISIDTVERYQGSQRDVIIYSFTIRRQSQLGFLTANCFMEGDRVIDRKLNVAITRARKQMIMTGNPDVLSRNNIFRELIKRYGVGD
jgi:superfamily I DNA and/or RNA helicase